MQLVTDMALPYVPATSSEFDNDPLSFIKTARHQHPWLAKTDQGYLVHGYHAVKDFSIMDDKCGPLFEGIVEMYGAKGTAWGDFMAGHVLALHGPEQVRIRNSIAPAFTPAAANRFRSKMRERMAELLDEWVPKGKFDFYEFVTNYPITVLCAVLGTGTEAVPRIRGFLEAQGQVFSLKLDKLPELFEGFDVTSKYLDELITEREKSGPKGDGSLLDSLIATRDAGQITDKELRYLLLVLFPGGYDTSRNMLTLTMYTMLSYPEYWARCAEDKAFCAKILEEMLRYSATAPPIRLVLEDFVYNDVLLPKGTRLFLCNPLAGRDPLAFPDADVFDPERVSTNRHVAFGRGAHMCPGQHLARAQIVEALHLMAQRIKNPRLAGEVKWRSFLGVWGPSTLPIEFEPALRHEPWARILDKRLTLI